MRSNLVRNIVLQILSLCVISIGFLTGCDTSMLIPKSTSTPTSTMTTTPTSTPTPSPTSTPTPTPVPDLTEADLWEAGFITLTKKADRFVIEKGELVLDLSLIADADDPQIPPSLSPIRIRGAILDQFEITSPVTLKVEVDPATGRHIYIVEDGELVDAQTDEAYSADSLIFAHDSELVPIMDPGPEQTVRWGKNGERLEHLELVDDEDAVFVWSVAAVAEPPTWAWQEPAKNITYSLTPEEQETYRVAQVELERTLQRLLDEEPVDLQAIRNLLQAEDASMIQFESKLYPIDSLAVRDIDGIPHLVTMVDPSERQQAQGYEPRFTILYPPSVLEMGPTRFEDIFGDALGVHSGNFITAFQATSAGGTQVEIHYEIGAWFKTPES